jgi:hypothetical protein
MVEVTVVNVGTKIVTLKDVHVECLLGDGTVTSFGMGTDLPLNPTEHKAYRFAVDLSVARCERVYAIDSSGKRWRSKPRKIDHNTPTTFVELTRGDSGRAEDV